MIKQTIHLNIFTPLSKEKSIQNEDFDIDNFLHFPILTNDDGSVWKHGSLYLLSKIKNYQKPSPKTLDSIAIDLKHFKEYCEKEDIDYLVAPRRVLRPTYLYRSYLQQLLRDGEISPNTIKRRMSAVVGFYEYLINTEGIEFKFPLWESGITSIVYQDNQGFKQSKQVKTKDVSRVVATSNSDLFDDAIVDGGRLHPLPHEQQIALIKALKTIRNTEMTLGFLISLTTGARIQTVFTLRKKHFERVLKDGESEVKIKVGYGTDCDTKFNKLHTLIFPSWVYQKVRIYLNSPRYNKREEKASHIFDVQNTQYIFLTNRGAPFYAAYDDPYRHLYKEVPNGATVRQFIFTSLKKQLKKDGLGFNFSFHDLRATFGMNLLDKLMPLVDSKELKLSHALIHIKERMGHSSLSTTEKYLNFRERHKIKEQAQDNYETYLMELLGE
ncbi:site-specific integrase [Aliarcobacter butzleri]|uniref:tyrosine-type recombinase/integrase n=1 Tax=Aliarcobacter butzleri TaxID=28197 RepID=UPI0021B2AF99|nr:site-specific integrase [Aliarcobacter butzleri]MCT7612692.1 site-specific integrase [Aliarcobacter butzleri]MCT7641334.1 site-specific integrase [Aliarcobacter butzleri]